MLTEREVILLGVETTYGQDPGLSAATHAVMVEKPSWALDSTKMIERKPVKASLGTKAKTYGGGLVKIGFSIEMKGSGTAGTAPEYAAAIKACGVAEKTLASAHTGTAQAGASATITLASGASAVDDAYVGMIIRTTGGTGPAQNRIIKDYVGSTKVATLTEAWTVTPDATTTYSIDAQNAYVPADSGHSSVCGYYYQDGMLRKIYGARARSAKIACEVGGRRMLEVELVGHGLTHGAVASATSTTVVLPATASAVDDTYNGQTITVTDPATGTRQSRTISDYTGSSKTATVTAWDTTPDSTYTWEIDGGPIDVALASPSFDTTVPPPFVNVPFSIGGYAAVISKLEFDFGLKTSTPPSVTSPDGFGEIRITGRMPKGSFDPEATLVATKDWENEWKTGVSQVIDTGAIGSTAGNRGRIHIPYAAYEPPTMGDRDGIRTYDISYVANESSGADEFYIIEN